MRLKELRKSKNLTQQQLADILHLARTTYKNYENYDREMSYQTLIKLADFFNVSVDYLIGRDSKNEIINLNNEEKTLLNIIRKLNQKNFYIAYGYVEGLLRQQEN